MIIDGNFLCNCIKIVKKALENISYLNSEYMKPLIQDTWNSIHKECNCLYSQTGYDHLVDINDDIKIKLSMNPKFCSAYFSESKHIQFNPLTLYFTTSKNFTLQSIDSSKIIFNPIFQQAGTLLHELDHYLYYKKYNMIDIKGDKKDKFFKEHIKDAEMRAYNNELCFYKKLQDDYPITYLSKDMILAVNPKPKKIIFKPYYGISKCMINKNIKHIEEILLGYKNYEQYSSKVEQDDIKRNERIANYFSKQIELKKEDSDYETVEISF